MPTYAYACKQCGHHFDAVQSFTDPTLSVCPRCGGALRKKYGSIGVTFHGSGFYRTDSRKTSASSVAPSHDAAAPAASSKAEAKASPAPAGS